MFFPRQVDAVLLQIMSTFEINSTFSGNDTSEEYIDTVESNVGNFTPFYVAIAISSVLLGLLLLMNIVCCCSRFAGYWLDKHTGTDFYLIF